MMKRKLLSIAVVVLSVLLLLLLLLPLVASCSDGEAPEPCFASSEEVTLRLSLSRGASRADTESTAEETAVTSAHVYIFDEQGRLENSRNTSVSNVPLLTAADMLNGQWRVKEGVKSVYVILNAKQLTHDLAAWEPVNISELKALITTADRAQGIALFNVTPYGGSKLMTGCRENILVTGSAGTGSIEIPVSRRYAAVELELRRGAALASQTVTVKGLKIYNTTWQSSVLEPAPYWTDGATDGEIVLQNTLTQTVDAVQQTPDESPAYDRMFFSDITSTDYLHHSHFYLSPRPASVSVRESMIPCIEITADVDGQEHIYRAYLTALKNGQCDLTRPLDVLGNHLYRIQATLTLKSLELNIQQWDLKEQDFPTGGGSWDITLADCRVGLDGTQADRTAIFSATLDTKVEVTRVRWFRRYQPDAYRTVVEELANGRDGVSISDDLANKSSVLTIVADGLDDSGEIYCRVTTRSEDNKEEISESNHATLMVVGTEVADAGKYPDMQNWMVPRNIPLGSTCLLRDARDGKVYRVKLMADGNWWMIQDLAYGNVSTPDIYDNYSLNEKVINQIETGLYGVCKSTGWATGGYIYNSYAAIQLPQGSRDDYLNGTAVKKTLIQGLCPQGWHLPGNMNGEPNKEWLNMQKVLKWDVTIVSGIMKMVYNDSFSFNAYTLNETVDKDDKPVDAISFWGGYDSVMANKVAYFRCLGFSVNDYDNGAVTNPEFALIVQDAISIRCLRNFK